MAHKKNLSWRAERSYTKGSNEFEACGQNLKYLFKIYPRKHLQYQIKFSLEIANASWKTINSNKGKPASKEEISKSANSSMSSFLNNKLYRKKKNQDKSVFAKHLSLKSLLHFT